MADLDTKKADESECVAHMEDAMQEPALKISADDSMPVILRALSAEEYAKIGRSAVFKMDIIILPCLMIMYILNYLDRNNIASAKLANIEEELGLTPTEYQSCVSVLFAGYSESSQWKYCLSAFKDTRTNAPDSYNADSFQYATGDVGISGSLHISSYGAMGLVPNCRGMRKYG